VSARMTTATPYVVDERVRALLAAAEDGPLWLAVQAPAGYGKSTLLRELAEAVQRGGADRGVIFVDDAHLLAEERLRELGELVAEQRGGLVLAYRPWPRPVALGELVTRLRPFVLAPFSERQTAEYLGSGASAVLARYLHAQAGGVPRFVERLAVAVEQPGGEVPPAALVQFRADLDGLPADVRGLLLASATGVELPADLLGALLDADLVQVDELLDAARATGLLGPDGRPVPVARRAVALLSPAAQRTAVWQRLAELQLARGGTVLPLARSVLAAGVGGAGLAAAFEAAADEALADEPALAAELFAHASAAGRPTAARRALAAALAGDLDAGLRIADQLVAVEGAPDRAAGAAVAATALAHRGQLGRSAELYGWSGTPSSVAFATVGFLGTGQPGRATQVAPDGPPTLLAGAAALMADGVRESLTGSATGALSTLVQAAALLEPAGQAVLLPDSPAALAAVVALHIGELDIGESVLDRAVAVDMGATLMSRRHRLLQAWILMVRGRTAAAEERLVSLGAARLEPRDLLFAAALEVGIARRNSDLAALHRGWGRAREAVMRHPVDLFTLLPLGELAVAAARLGEQARLTAHLRDAETLLERLGHPPLWTTPLRWSGLHAAILAEEPAAADDHVAALVRGGDHSRYGAVVAAAALSWIEVLRGIVDPAKVEAAARGLHGAGLCWDAARLAGQAAIRTSDRRAMTALLDCARLFQGRPQGTRSSAAEQLPDATAQPAQTRLSEREQEVAELVLTGLTYKQIGDRLFISAKTVEHHVARMRQRLGCTSRSDLLARLRAMTADRPGGEPLRRAPWPRRPSE
jgi:DNA-binding CsgD family transcriptional regulator